MRRTAEAPLHLGDDPADSLGPATVELAGTGPPVGLVSRAWKRTTRSRRSAASTTSASPTSIARSASTATCSAFASARAGGAYLEGGSLWLCLALDAPRPARDYTHFALDARAADTDAWRRRLAAHDVERWKENTSEGDSICLLDPDGHRLELHAGDLASRLAAARGSPYEGMVLADG